SISSSLPYRSGSWPRRASSISIPRWGAPGPTTRTRMSQSESRSGRSWTTAPASAATSSGRHRARLGMPGSRQQYSNAGYIVLGLLIERLSGTSYYDYVERHIFAPAGMTRTASWRVDSLPPNTATGYTAEGRNTDLLPGRGSSAGGGYSTTHDLLRLLNALREHKIENAPEAGMVGIAGGAPGLNAVMEGDLPGGYDVVVMANLSPPAAERVGRLIRDGL